MTMKHTDEGDSTRKFMDNVLGDDEADELHDITQEFYIAQAAYEEAQKNYEKTKDHNATMEYVEARSTLGLWQLDMWAVEEYVKERVRRKVAGYVPGRPHYPPKLGVSREPPKKADGVESDEAGEPPDADRAP